jgi:hypothetical protein
LKPVDDQSNLTLSLTGDSVFRALAAARIFGSEAEFKKLFQYVYGEIFQGRREEYAIYDSMWNSVENVPGYSSNQLILKDIVDLFWNNKRASPLVRSAYRQLVLLQGGKDPNVIRSYLTFFDDATTDDKIDVADYVAFFLLLGQQEVLSDDSLALQAISLTEKLRTPSDSRLRGAFSLVLFRLMLVYQRAEQLDKSNQVAHELLSLLDDSSNHAETAPTFPSAWHDDMRKSALDHLRTHEKVVTVVNPYRRLSRNSVVNVRYPDGTLARKKFKLVQRDLILGRCSLVDAFGSVNGGQ